ncbi:hypothetical protein A3860_33370 [Niastella vici]|uniref:Outer membrane protein beta-barrel domain-containing protein n=1 Tax=Niastella vici TaxID=1703345 RepID=A0A1V9FQ79_9BACT|nr:hypothetical protein [Niastella vici]OQP60478.1 hypothetical protein A3860_33370 [Niastella vici]
MKRISITLPVILLSMILCQRAKAQDYRFAAGVRLSNSSPTLSSAISAKYFATDKTAIEALVAWGNRFGLGGLIEIHNKFNTPGLSWFYGGGVYVGFQDGDTYFGPTGIAGLDYKFTNAPVNLSLDWKPELDILPKINFVADAFALTIRFALK